MKRILDKKISRRTLLKSAVVVAGVALTPAFTGCARTPEKLTKAAVQYQDNPKDDQQCSRCTFFIPGQTSAANGACQLVEGAISPQGWCNKYNRKV